MKKKVRYIDLIYGTTPEHSNYKYNKWQKILPQAMLNIAKKKMKFSKRAQEHSKIVYDDGGGCKLLYSWIKKKAEKKINDFFSFG